MLDIDCNLSHLGSATLQVSGEDIVETVMRECGLEEGVIIAD